MKKNPIRDYATDAYRYWASVGCPTYEGQVKKIKAKAKRQAVGVSKDDAEAFVAAEMERHEAALLDIKACSEAFAELEAHGKGCVVSAVREVYMVLPRKRLTSGEIAGRVVRHSMTKYYSERQVYRFLDEACEAFARHRKLRQDKEENTRKRV